MGQISIGTIISLISLCFGGGCLVKIFQLIKELGAREERIKTKEENIDAALELLKSGQVNLKETIERIAEELKANSDRDAIMGKIIDVLSNNQADIERDIQLLKTGQQASLRDRLVQCYSHYSELGYMPYDEKQAWLNSYTAYHNLGENGVMDGIKEEVLKLPLKEKEEE